MSTPIEIDDTFVKTLADLSADSTLEALQLDGLDLGDADILKLVEVLKTKPRVKKIDLSDNDISDIGVKALTEILTLEELNLAQTRITDSGVESLAAMLNNPACQLHTLDLRDNDIGDLGVRHLANKSSLRVLDLTGCNISSKGAAEIFSNPTLEDLDLSDNSIRDEGLINLKNSSLRKLNLFRCGITASGAKLIAENNTLKTLNLTQNRIADGSNILAKHSSIESLILADNAVKDITAFAENTVLKSLAVFSNSIEDAGVLGLSRNNTLLDIDLSFNNLSGEGAKELIGIRSLVKLEACFNRRISAVAFKEILNEIQGSSIEYADFKNDKIAHGVITMSFDIKRKKTDSEYDNTTSKPVKSSSPEK
jgi:Leucine-rich repeat (LRR) protein